MAKLILQPHTNGEATRTYKARLGANNHKARRASWLLSIIWTREAMALPGRAQFGRLEGVFRSMRHRPQEHGRGRFRKATFLNGECLRLSCLTRTPGPIIAKGPSEVTDPDQPSRTGYLGPSLSRPTGYRYILCAIGEDEQQAGWPSILGTTPLTHSRPHGKLPSPPRAKLKKTSLAAQHLSTNLALFNHLVCKSPLTEFWKTSMNCPPSTETHPRRFYYTSSRPEVSGWPNIPPNLPTSPSLLRAPARN